LRGAASRRRLTPRGGRDHRALGAKQKLFAFHDSSPGSAFMLPHGMLVQNRLVAMLRDEYARRGYDEVGTPLLYRKALWQKSGHWEHYAKDMFFLEEASGTDLGLKPMNCPGHCELYAMEGARSYKQLPLRLADFSALHRNELSGGFRASRFCFLLCHCRLWLSGVDRWPFSPLTPRICAGALSGLTRVRRFHQDDAHIFCTPEQIAGEIRAVLSFVLQVYQTGFGFAPKFRLATRPAKSAGSDESWARAEAGLRQALEDAEVRGWTLSPGDGAFYGPKIDVAVEDALGRAHQVGTIQLDFQLPERFGLEYTDALGQSRRPVMVHRAVLGSLERFTAILLEHTNGKLPFWLCPRQVCVVPVAPQEPRLAEYVVDSLSAFPPPPLVQRSA
jgi:threonyl-tRNA synthetase